MTGDDHADGTDEEAPRVGSLPESGAAGNGCECAGGPAESPSIYQEFWRDDRAEIARRDYAKALATIGGLTAVASLAAPVVSLTQVFERSYTGPVYSDGVALVDGEGERVTEGRLAEGEQLTVFPESHPGISDAPTLLVRFGEDQYGEGTNMEFTVGGYAAYSKVCTHAGCMVADRQGETLVCPCHSGRFDPLTGASVTGGPPPRALPQLPITLSSEGHLIATGDFEGSVGPGGGG
ncbi:QcrA and Rieske domain-containing protein [Halostella salina]|uniref:QcrA and Rieske domain-containing protein n=1 Tax=Halostella salina TaxID=1547897 RepID=UPI000EF7B43B|nr:Rieske 2Fe-2S domain-containing protein [Halostella salina]